MSNGPRDTHGFHPTLEPHRMPVNSNCIRRIGDGPARAVGHALSAERRVFPVSARGALRAGRQPAGYAAAGASSDASGKKASKMPVVVPLM